MEFTPQCCEWFYYPPIVWPEPIVQPVFTYPIIVPDTGSLTIPDPVECAKVSSTPEPSAAVMLLIGLALIVISRKAMKGLRNA